MGTSSNAGAPEAENKRPERSPIVLTSMPGTAAGHCSLALFTLQIQQRRILQRALLGGSSEDLQPPLAARLNSPIASVITASDIQDMSQAICACAARPNCGMAGSAAISFCVNG